MYCVVKHCKTTWKPKSSIRLHTFPRDPNRRRQWLSKIALKGKFYTDAKICSLHFKAEDYDPERPERLIKSASPLYMLQGCSCCTTNQNVEQNNSSILKLENTEDSTHLLMDQSDSNLVSVDTAKLVPASNILKDLLESPIQKNIEQDNSSILEFENTEDSAYLRMDQSDSSLQNVKDNNSTILEFENTEDATYLEIDQSDSSPVAVDTAKPDPASKSLKDLLELPTQNDMFRKMKQLQPLYLKQRKDIKRLNQIIYRQKKKIDNLRNIIKDLVGSDLLDSESSVTFEECDNTKDLHAKKNS